MKRLTCAIISIFVIALSPGCEETTGPRPAPSHNDSEDANDNTGQNDNRQSNDANANQGQNDPASSCDAQSVCHDYCTEKHVRCLDENCPGLTGYGTQEYQLCMHGLDTENDEGERETFLEGCIERVGDDNARCEATGDDADRFAQQGCDSDEQEYRQCNNLRLFMTTLGDEVYGACGCSAASTGESCSEDDQCDEYGDGLCLKADAGDRSICTAGCNDFDGNPPGPILPDPSCGEENGICMELGQTLDDGSSSICQIYCTELADCPSGASCAPVFQLRDAGSLGLCTRGILWDIPFELCLESEDCPQGTDCREGTCQPSCSGNDTPCDVGECGDDGFCTVDFEEIF